MSEVDKDVAPWYMGSRGTTRFSQQEAKSFCRRILSTDAYRVQLEKRLLSGSLPPALETMLWHYSYGRPVETVVVREEVEDLSVLSVSDLAKRMSEMQAALRQAEEIEQELVEDGKPVSAANANPSRIH